MTGGRGRWIAIAAVVVALPTAVCAWAAARETWWLVAAVVTFLSCVTLLAASDADRRARETRAFVQRELRGLAAEQRRMPDRQQQVLQDLLDPERQPADPNATRPQDLYGTVRLLQEQYVGRLDRMQDTLDRTLEQLRGR